MALDKFEKQSADVQDFDLSYVDYLARFGDTGQTILATTITKEDGTVADATIGTPVTTHAAGITKVWVVGGTHGTRYKITSRLQTVAGRVKEHEILVLVKDR